MRGHGKEPAGHEKARWGALGYPLADAQPCTPAPQTLLTSAPALRRGVNECLEQ
jgi:hypothetical protein